MLTVVLTVETVMETTAFLNPAFQVILVLIFLLLAGLMANLMVAVSELKGSSIRQIHISRLPMGWYSIAFYYDDDRVSVIGHTDDNKGRIFVIYHMGLLPRQKYTTGKEFFAGRNDDGIMSVMARGESRAINNPQQPAPSTT